MFNHGVGYIDWHLPTAKVLHVQCLCGKVFYPDKDSAFAEFNCHLDQQSPTEEPVGEKHAESGKRFDEKRARLEAQDTLAQRVDIMTDWLKDRIEQHEVFGDEVGSNVDYELLLLFQKICAETASHLEQCPFDFE